MNQHYKPLHHGILAALGAALLFGCSTPVAKMLLSGISPWMLAGLLYLGSGFGLALYRIANRAPAVMLPKGEWLWLSGAVLSGGVIAPVLLMFALTRVAASEASLLLNTEGVFTALLAWFAFRENFDRRIVLGMAAIAIGSAVLTWPGESRMASAWPAMAVLGACLAWGIDNNLTRKVSEADAAWIASMKGLTAGSVNLVLAFLIGEHLPPAPELAASLVIGWLAYGVSLTLFVVGLRNLGTARTGAYFSVAPFFGAIFSIPMLGEPVSMRLLAAGGFMALGISLHLTEHHIHPHTHEPVEHEHEHIHEGEHRHAHDHPVPDGEKHSHLHYHEPVTHAHMHYPDVHHRHKH